MEQGMKGLSGLEGIEKSTGGRGNSATLSERKPGRRAWGRRNYHDNRDALHSIERKLPWQ